MNPYPTPPAPRVRDTGTPRLGESMEDAARSVLARLDPRRATAEQVRDALGVAGIRVPIALAGAWLEGRRGAS